MHWWAGSPLVKATICCLLAPSHHLYQGRPFSSISIEKNSILVWITSLYRKCILEGNIYKTKICSGLSVLTINSIMISHESIDTCGCRLKCYYCSFYCCKYLKSSRFLSTYIALWKDMSPAFITTLTLVVINIIDIFQACDFSQSTINYSTFQLFGKNCLTDINRDTTR